MFPPAPDFGRLLLDAKLSVPQPGRGVVDRAELIRTARSSDCRVVGVTAPAGYGKSTFLGEWARAEDRRVAWVSLDRLDDDPAALVALLAHAYARVDPAGADLVAGMSGPGMSVLGRAAPRLAAAFHASPTPFVFMLDDLHELASPACHDVLGIVISKVPKGSQFVAASRSEQPHLPRWRASGDAVELTAVDLALDAAGAQQIFAAADVGLTSDQAAAVTERTEGWPAGLYLAALIARESNGQVITVTGDDRYLADYLYRESMIQLPENLHRFLRCTAVLDQLCGPLCDAVLESSGAADQLRRLEASNSFLVPLDRRREWYRYHGLFREFLLGELRRIEPDVVAKLHLRAADWYQANGSPVLALEHLLNTSERDRAAQLVAELAVPTYDAGQVSTVQRWLGALGDRDIEGYPPLAVLAGWASALTGDSIAAERWAAVAGAASFGSAPGDGSTSFESARAMLRAMMCASGPESMLADATFAVVHEPVWSRWRRTALMELGEAHLLIGDREAARAAFVESCGRSQVIDDTSSAVSEAELALLAMGAGDWQEAADRVTRALAIVEHRRLHDYLQGLLTFAGAARLALHRGDLDDARVQLGRAMRGRTSATHAVPFVAVRLRLQLAMAYLDLSEPKTARHLLNEIDDILIHRPALGCLIDEVDAVRVRATHANVGGAGASPLSPAELRLLPYLQTHLTIAQIGARLFLSRNTVNSEFQSIYRKLGVSSRHDAVQQATVVGLLGD